MEISDRRLSFDISGFALRLLVGWMLLSAIGLVYSRELVSFFLPYFSFIIHEVQSDFLPTLDIIGTGTGAELRMSAQAIRDIPLNSDKYIPALSRIDYTKADLSHVLVPAVLFLSGMVSWPVRNFRELVYRIAFGTCAMLIVMSLTTPLFLAGKFEMWLSDNGAPSVSNWLVDWLIFTEVGGRWLLPIVAATASVSFSRFLTQGRTIVAGL